MKKGKLIGKIFGIALVFAMVLSTLGGFPNTVNIASASDLGGISPVTVRVKTVTHGDGSVKTLDLESEYLPVVVACENQNAYPEAMMAQAVASRTYALYFKEHPLGADFDLYDGQMSQVYNPGDPTHPVLPKHEQAVADTSGVVLKYNGSPICAFFVSGKNIPGVDETYIYVTNNEGKTGDDVTPSPIGDPTNPLNRGCMGQIQADELASIHSYDYRRILKYFYGADIEGLSTTALDLVFAIDSSGSMSWNDPSDLRLAGSKMLVNGLDPSIDRVGVVSWDSDIDFTYPLSTDLSGAKGAIDNVDSSGGTNLNIGLSKAIEVMDIGKRADAKHIIVFITNGHGTYTPAGAGGPAYDAGEKGYVIYAVGLAGEDIPVTSHLEDMAGATGGEWFVAYSAEDLLTILDYIGRQAATTAHVEVTPRSWDFNVLVVGCTAEKQLIVSNAEDEKDITIMDIITPDYIELDAGCWFPWWCPAMPPTDLSPGESRAYSLCLDSDSLAGIVDDTIIIKVKPKEGGEVQTVAIPVTGTVVCDPEVLLHYSEVASSLSEQFQPEAAFEQAIDLAVEAIDDAYDAMVDRATQDYLNTLVNIRSYAQNMRSALDQYYWGLTLIWAEQMVNLSLDRYVNGFNSISVDLSNAAIALENAQAASDPDDVDAYLQQASESFEAAMQNAAELDEYFNVENPELTGVDDNDRGALKGPYSAVWDFADHLGDTIHEFSLLLTKEESLVIIADSPVDLIVENPLGEVISRTINEILGSKYLETDVDGDGEKEDLVIIYSRQPGVYLITPIPHEGTTPEETYSLGWISGDEKGVIVEGQPVGDIPADGFMLFSNEAPSADAGSDKTVCAISPAMTAMVSLDGSGSYDPDGDPLTYTWTWDGNTACGVNPTVELPPGTTTITLVVNDGKVDSGPDTVDITVQILATIDFDPDVLNLETKGKYVTAYIELPPGYDVSQIDVSSIRLNGTVPALGKPTEVDDYDGDGIPDLMVKFDTAAVQDALTVGEEIEVTITGEVNGIIFEGSDTIRVITAAAGPGRAEWTRVTTPTTDGFVLAPDSVIVDYAVAEDGDAAYAIVYSYDTSQFHLLKSTDSAATWEDIMDALEEEVDGDISWLVAVATDAEDADFVAVALEMTDFSVHMLISDDGGATFEDAGEVESGGIYFPDGYYVSDLEVSPEDDGARDIAIVGQDNSFDAVIFRCQAVGELITNWEDARYTGWDDNGAFTSMLITDVKFAPSWDADRTILITTVTETGMDIYTVHLQTGTWGTTEGWNAESVVAIDAVPIMENVDIPVWLSDLGARAIAGITVPLDYSGRYSNKRYVWVWVNHYDDGIPPMPRGTVFRVKNDDADPVGPMGQIEDGEVWLTNVDYLGYISEGKAIAGVLGTGTYDPVHGSPEDLLAECCEGVQVYRNDGIVNMDICCMPWEEACKPPTGRFAIEAFYVGEDKAYAVALWGLFLPYDEDAWSVSFDDGDDWNQLSLVDTHIDYLSDIAVSPDCNKTMLVSVNEESGCECDSVWLHAEDLPEAEEYSGKWLRTWCGQLEGCIGEGWERGLLRLVPEETTGDTVYLVDYGTDTVYWNELETLDCWEEGTATVEHIIDLAVKDKETIYALDYYGDVAMSDDYALGWYAPVDSKVEYGWTIAVRGDDILVGGCDGDVSHSDDGGETFTELEEIPVVADYTLVTLVFDRYFDANDTIYAAAAGFEGSSPVTGGIYRWVIGESDDWEDVGADTYAYTGLMLNAPSGGKPETSPETGGVLYASYVGYDDALLVSGMARCMTPAKDVRRLNKWDYLTRGLTSELFKMTPQALKICGCLTTDTNSRLFAIDSSEYYDVEEGKTGTVWRFED